MRYRISILFFLSFSLLFSSLLYARDIVWESGTKIKVEIKPTVVYMPESQKFSYEYELISKPKSEQKVETFDVEFRSEIYEIFSPSGWEADDLSKFPVKKNLVGSVPNIVES